MTVYVNVKDAPYGAKGDGATDDTPAINAALAYLATITPFTTDGRSSNLPTLYFPEGKYRIRAGLNPITTRNIHILGADKNSTQIWYNPVSDDAGAVVFDIGTFSPTPTNLFAGTQGATFENIRIQHWSPGTPGARKAQAIRSSGGGDLILRNVAVQGFAYGVNCPYGGDFNYYDHVEADYCDVGFYLGPGAQQVLASFLYAFGCQEGLVLDRVMHLHLQMPVFVSCGISGITLEAITHTSTRQLTSFSPSSTYSGKMIVQTPWFEANAGGMGDTYTPTHHIGCSNGGTQPYRGLEVLDAYVVGNGPTKTPTSLVGTVSGLPMENVHVVRPVMRGRVQTWFYNPTPSWKLEDQYVIVEQSVPRVTNTGTLAAVPSITGGTAQPTTGAFHVGDFVSNATPAVVGGKVLLGWSRLTTGSTHVTGTDWTPVYATTS